MGLNKWKSDYCKEKWEMGLMGYLNLIFLIFQNGIRDINDWKRFKLSIVNLFGVNIPVW